MRQAATSPMPPAHRKRATMCQIIGEREVKCPTHTEPIYVLSLHRFLEGSNDNTANHLRLSAQAFACTIEGQRRISVDHAALTGNHHTLGAAILSEALTYGQHVLRDHQDFVDSRVGYLHKEITRLWARVVPSSDTVFTTYLDMVASELGTTPDIALRKAAQIAADYPPVTITDPAAVRFVIPDTHQPEGAVMSDEIATLTFHLETMTAHARNNTRLVHELPDPEGGVWQEYLLPTGKTIAYNPLREELLLPDVDADATPRVYREVDESLAFALTSARRPGFLVAAAFFPATTGSLHHAHARDFAFAHQVANDVFPVSSVLTGPAPERILPEPVRRSIQHGLL